MHQMHCPPSSQRWSPPWPLSFLFLVGVAVIVPLTTFSIQVMLQIVSHSVWVIAGVRLLRWFSQMALHRTHAPRALREVVHLKVGRPKTRVFFGCCKPPKLPFGAHDTFLETPHHPRPENL